MSRIRIGRLSLSEKLHAKPWAHHVPRLSTERTVSLKSSNPVIRFSPTPKSLSPRMREAAGGRVERDGGTIGNEERNSCLSSATFFPGASSSPLAL
jgi:hypothetical protein